MIADRHERAGFTLFELVVVLAILSIVAGTATFATVEYVEEARYDATVDRLRATESAMLGEPGLVDANGRPWVRGFVADVGRLPRAVGDEPSAQLAELWTPEPTALPVYALQSPPGDLEVRLGAGWRGPYLDLPLGVSRWRDGFGHAPFLTDDSGEPLLAGSPIAVVRSLGADGAPGGEGYAADLDVSALVAGGVDRHTGTLRIRVDVTGVREPLRLVIRAYGPRDGVVRSLGHLHRAIAADGEWRVEFDGLPIGDAVVRAYLVEDEGAVTADASLDAVSKSRIVPVVVVAGSAPEVSIELEAPEPIDEGEEGEE